MTELGDKLRFDAEKIYTGAIRSCLPDNAVREALKDFSLPKGRLILVSIGKAAWRMAKCAKETVTETLGGKIYCGAVITKYGHSEGEIEGLEIYEAAHPVPDEAGINATEKVLSMTENLTEDDLVLFLISGGGSALFESPLCTPDELSALTKALLASGADISEINAIRKHISKVKGGRFAEHIYPAKFFAIALSDVIGNRLDTIASGPVSADPCTTAEVQQIIKKYDLEISDGVYQALMSETPKSITNGTHFIGGSVTELCKAAERICATLGYKTEILTDCEVGVAREVGVKLAKIAVEKSDTDTPLAYIIGGETVVVVNGNGLGGRNQEIALTASLSIVGYDNIAIFSVGSDGTDGPTDAAGGFADGNSYAKMTRIGIDPQKALENNDSYNALKAIDGLIVTGPTGTNVNDITIALIGRYTASKPDLSRRFANLERVMNEGIKNV